MPSGAVAVEEFVRGGGTLITLGASGRWAIDLFEIDGPDIQIDLWAMTSIINLMMQGYAHIP